MTLRVTDNISQNRHILEVYTLFRDFCFLNEHIDEQNRITLQLQKSSPFLSTLMRFDSQVTCFSLTRRLIAWKWSFLFFIDRACSFGANSMRVNTSTSLSSSLGEACSGASDHQSAFRNLAHLLIRTCPRTHRQSAEWAGSHVVCPCPVFSILTLPRRKFWETFPPENTSSHRHTRAATLVHDICNGKQEFHSSAVRLLTLPPNSQLNALEKQIFHDIDLIDVSCVYV